MKRQTMDNSQNILEDNFIKSKKVKASNFSAENSENTKNVTLFNLSPPIKMSYLFYRILPSQLEDQYEVLEELARGASGRVYEALHRKSNTYRAIKHIKKKINENDLKEIELLRKLSHPNIFTPIEYCVDSDNLFIVSELCRGGSLFEKISKEKQLDESKCKAILRQILLGLNYIHSKNIVHRDIKPENLLFESDSSDALIKIIDFGISDNYAAEVLNKVCGTAFYVAPEVLHRNYNEKCDIWSLGAVLYCMITGRNLIEAQKETEIFQKLYNIKEVSLERLDNAVSDPCRDFISQMLIVDYSKRPSAGVLLEHSWFVDNMPFIINDVKESGVSKALKNLRNFTRYNYLHNIIYFYTTSCILHNEEKHKLSLIFQEIDTDCDGRLKFDDLVLAFQRSGRSFQRSRQLVDRIFGELQIDLNEGIAYSEFLTVCCDKQTLKNEFSLKKAFSVWDSEAKGKIDIETIKSILQRGSFSDNPEIYKIGEMLIYNEIGPKQEVSFEEFKQIMNRFAEDEQMSQSIV